MDTDVIEPVRRVEQVWGTAISIDVRDAIAPALLDVIVAWFRRVDDLFSTWRADSEISRLGRGELTLDATSPHVRTVLALCDRVKSESSGAFDVTFGADPRVEPRDGLGAIDPSGLVKGWALDHAAGLLRAEGIRNFTINAGGDVITRGRPGPDLLWRVGIQHPWHRLQVAAVVGGTDLAVATSGRYERGEHIIDPNTGLPATGLTSVSVIADDLAMADGYATAAVVLGATGMDWLAGLTGVEAIAITDSRTVVVTEGFQRYRIA